MSLIIHTIVKDGIVISADSRTTCKNEKGYTRYNDTAEKIFIFMDSVVITHCGNTMINTKLSVEKFLADFKREYYKNCRINELPVLLLNEYIKKVNVSQVIRVF